MAVNNRFGIFATDIKGQQYCPGIVVDGHIFQKKVSNKDQLQSPVAWTISKDVFDLLPRYGVDTIRIINRDEGKMYVVSLRKFQENCLYLDRHNGMNAVLALPFWMVFAA